MLFFFFFQAEDGIRDLTVTGVQTCALPILQRLRDAAVGIDSAGFVSGYRGSPLGGFDLELWRARKHLEAAKVKFTPGLNEDLGATMVWGTQQTNQIGRASCRERV